MATSNYNNPRRMYVDFDDMPENVKVKITVSWKVVWTEQEVADFWIQQRESDEKGHVCTSFVQFPETNKDGAFVHTKEKHFYVSRDYATEICRLSEFASSDEIKIRLQCQWREDITDECAKKLKRETKKEFAEECERRGISQLKATLPMYLYSKDDDGKYYIKHCIDRIISTSEKIYAQMVQKFQKK